MKTARLITAIAAIAAGVAVLSPGGSSYAAWSDEVSLRGASLSSGELGLRDTMLSATVTRAGTVNPIGNVAELRVGDVVVIKTSTGVALQGDALSATLALADGFLLADGTPARNVSTRVSTSPGTPPLVGSATNGWQVGAGHNGAIVEATITLPITEENRSVGDGRVAWSLNQNNAGSAGGGWSSETSIPIDLPAVVDDVNPWRPRVTSDPDDLGVVGNVKTFKFTWSWSKTASDATVWQLLHLRDGGRWEVLKSANGSATSFTVTSDDVKAFATNDATTEFLVRVYPTGLAGEHFDATHAFRMRYSSSAGHMEFVQLVPVAEGAVG